MVGGWIGTLLIALALASWGGASVALYVLVAVSGTSLIVFGVGVAAFRPQSKSRAVVLSTICGALTGSSAVFVLDRIDAALSGAGPHLIEILVLTAGAAPIGALGGWMGAHMAGRWRRNQQLPR